MELKNSKDIFKDALKNKYAIGAFNFVNLETLKAILNTAQKLQSPVVVQCSTGAIKYAGIDTLVALVKSMVKNMTVPVVLNLDHGKTFEDCKNAVDAGFTNVMIDASSLSFGENVALTKKVVQYAHLKNVTVEAELGVLAGIEDEVSATKDDARFTDPDQALDFVKLTGVDSLAVAIGTSHGAYKFSGEGNLRFDILEKIQNKLPNFPFVLHGASSVPDSIVKKFNKYGGKIENASGVPEKLLAQASEMNICKVNVDTDIRIAYGAGIRQSFIEKPSNFDIRTYNEKAMENVEEVVAHKMEKVFLSAGKIKNERKEYYGFI